MSWAAHIFGAGWEAREASLPCLQTQRGAGSISWLVQLDIFTNNGPESFSTNGTATLGPHLQGSGHITVASGGRTSLSDTASSDSSRLIGGRSSYLTAGPPPAC